MNKLRVIIIFALCLFYNNARTQSIESINYILDSVYYYYHYAHEINYNIQIELPDSVKQKAINVLDGYLPSQKIKEATTFSGEVIKDIEKKAKSICGEDSICNAFSKDSIIKCDIKHQLDIFRQAAFSSNFILAIGAWDVREAEPILLKNINNKKYPKRETMLALAKLGNDSIYKLVMQEYTLKYVVNNTVLKDNDPDLIYESFPVDEQINYQISFFYQAGMYLKNKGILLNLIDLLDIQGKTYVFEELIPIEECFLMWLSTRFITKELLDNGEYNKLEKIVDDYLYEIDKYDNTENIRNILSKEHKEKIKIQLKNWIIKNVNFN